VGSSGSGFGHGGLVNVALAELIESSGGVVTRSTALGRFPEHVIDYAVRAGHVVRPYPGVLVAPASLADPAIRCRAALAYAGPDAALSHVSALATWGLPVVASSEVHVVTGHGRRLRAPGIVAHRRAQFVANPPAVVVRSGVPVTRLEQSIVDAWALSSGPDQRAALLRAVGERMTTAARVRSTLERAPHLLQRAELRLLLDKIETGCRSELELWGHDHVFSGPGMPSFRRQVPVRLGGHTVYLDLLHEATLTDIELDGAAWHGSVAARERDLRRDAALAARGYQVVRYSNRRLVDEPETVRREVLTVIAARSMIIGPFP